jgi:septum formation protein
VAAEVTHVTFAHLSDEDIAGYIASGEPKGKAGAYAIQGRAARWIPRIHGCYFNVVGLPLALAGSMIEAAKRRIAVEAAAQSILFARGA